MPLAVRHAEAPQDFKAQDFPAPGSAGVAAGLRRRHDGKAKLPHVCLVQAGRPSRTRGVHQPFGAGLLEAAHPALHGAQVVAESRRNLVAAQPGSHQGHAMEAVRERRLR